MLNPEKVQGCAVLLALGFISSQLLWVTCLGHLLTLKSHFFSFPCFCIWCMVGSILCTTTKAPAAFSLNFLSILRVWSPGHQSLLMALQAKIAQDQFPFEILIVASPKWAGKYYRVSNSCMHFSSPLASLLSYVTIAIVWKTYVTSHQKHIVSQERIGQSC